MDDVLIALNEIDYGIIQALAAKEFLDGRLMERPDYGRRRSEILCVYFLRGQGIMYGEV